MFFKKLLANLHLFDGDGAAAAAPAAAASEGETNGAVPGTTRRGRSGEYDGIKFGKQTQSAENNGAEDTNKSSVAGSDKEDAKASLTPEERRKAFEALINGEYKDLFTEKTQNVIDRRFRETKQLEQQKAKTQPLIDTLMQRYNIADGDVDKLQAAIDADNSYWEAAARDAGMDTEQYKEMLRLKRENAAFNAERERARSAEAINNRINGWMKEGEAMKADYPDFSLEKESENPQFMAMLRSGVPIKHAYEVIHMDDIKANITASAEKRIVDNVRAKGTRPAENGTSARSAFTVKDDVSKLSKKDRAEIARRVARGEYIEF